MGIDIVGIDLHRRSIDLRRRFARAKLLPVAVVAAVALSGCAAGQDAQTANQQPAIDGVNADSGLVGIRDAAIAAPSATNYAAGSDAELQLTLINNGLNQDSLVAVTSTAAAAAVIGVDGPPSSNQGVNVTPLESGSPSSGSSESASASPTASAGSSAPSTPADVPIVIPGQSSVQVGVSIVGPSAVLTGLAKPLFPAQTVPVTFRFSSGATINVDLATRLTSGGASAPTVNISPSGES
ncbi:MAG: hypothetical protein JWN95_2026 [Frankiales bacterium]|nr:hypothetical protein [Frankiales bacterium]